MSCEYLVTFSVLATHIFIQPASILLAFNNYRLVLFFIIILVIFSITESLSKIN